MANLQQPVRTEEPRSRPRSRPNDDEFEVSGGPASRGGTFNVLSRPNTLDQPDRVPTNLAVRNRAGTEIADDGVQ
ncbi:MAG TPA: hypothetical protein VFB81_23945, partial [Myxococcales bacterium]|nr:hypothetical protein [Myxococcales bacterium]